MDAIVTLTKTETCQVLIRNVPKGHTKTEAEWVALALSARGKDWEERNIEVERVEHVSPGSDDLPSVDFK